MMQDSSAANQAKSKHMMLWVIYGFTIFLGAFLLFLIQPVVGKIVTSRFGGGSSVWLACMMFFQTALLAGYLLTFFLSKAPRLAQGITYALLLSISIFWAFQLAHPQTGSDWNPNPEQQPLISLLVVLLSHVGTPCILLSALSGTLQNWFRLAGMHNPYPLYSISNIGSLGALLAYPLLFEPRLTIPKTLELWNVAYLALVVFVVVCLILMAKWGKNEVETEAISEDEINASEDDGITFTRLFGWIGLSALGSVLLLAFTNMMTHDIAPVPLLWVIPLTVYLYTFVLCFSKQTFYHRPIYLGVAQILLVLYLIKAKLPVMPAMVLVLALLFTLCMICHGEIVARKPHAKKLPQFYLTIAFGGALGGSIVNFLAPTVFPNYWELPIVLYIAGFLTIYFTIHHDVTLFFNRWVQRIVHGGLFAFLLLYVMGTYVLHMKAPDAFKTVLQARNFYGTVALKEDRKNNFVGMFNGTILHGGESTLPGQALKRLTYYHDQSAVALVFRYLHSQYQTKPLKIGVVGLGTGTMATFMNNGDTMIFYELDPKVEWLAKSKFKFLKESPGENKIELGDGRLTLEAEEPQKFDLLMVDAFSSDAIPIHLLTREAFATYEKHLKPEGLLLFHVSNRYLNIAPVVVNQALDKKWYVNTLFSEGNPEGNYLFNSRFVTLSPNSNFANYIEQKSIIEKYPHLRMEKGTWNAKIGLWTDDYSNLISVFY